MCLPNSDHQGAEKIHMDWISKVFQLCVIYIQKLHNYLSIFVTYTKVPSAKIIIIIIIKTTKHAQMKTGSFFLKFQEEACAFQDCV